MTIFHASRVAGDKLSMSINEQVVKIVVLSLFSFHTLLELRIFLNLPGVFGHSVFHSVPFKTENAGQTASLVPTCTRCPGLA